MDDIKTSVLVIGAGLSGLAAAQHLINEGLTHVIVLEASNRLGGRIHTEQFCDATVELGATWIHGEGSVSELAEIFQLIDNAIITDEYDGKYIDSSGKQCNNELVRRASSEFRKILEDVYRKKHVEKMGKHPSLLDGIQYNLRQVLDTVPEHDRDEFRDIFRHLMKVEEENHGASLEDTSACVPDIICPGKNIHIPNGYKTLVARLAGIITDKRIHLKTEVVQIDYTNPNGVKVHCKASSGMRSYSAECVVVTVSLGILKRHHRDLFNPGLSQEKKRAIEQLGFGVANKIFLHFKSPFWSPDVDLRLVWRQRDIESNSSLPDWAKCLYVCNTFINSPNTLCFWMCGDEGKQIEDVTDDVIIDVITQVLRLFLNDPTLPEPDAVIKTSWFSNNLFRGSYAYIRAGCSVSDINTLSEPIVNEHGQPVVLFAGEATDADYIATTHGSFNSGIREANRILCLKKYI